MPTTRFLDADRLHDELVRAGRAARGHRFVATPYLTAGAINVRLGAGDVLLVALTTANCANGSVDPREVERLIMRGDE